MARSISPRVAVTALLLSAVVACGGFGRGATPVVYAQDTPPAPWQAALTSNEEPPPFSPTCFVPFDTAKSLPQADDLRQWFDVIVGQPQGIFETRTKVGLCAGIEGIVRLKSPWVSGTALKFALEDYNRLQIHLFSGASGVTLVYHEDELSRWVAYATRRQPQGVTPSAWRLAATDEHRNRRTFPKGQDQYELRYVNGEIVLSRGDVILIRVPLESAPQDVFFQGKAAFHGLALTKSEPIPLPELSAVQGQVVLPASVPWMQQLDEKAESGIQPDGSFKLSVAEGPKKRSFAATPIPRGVPAEVLLQIADATPGSGIYLGNGQAGPRFVLRYATDRRSKQFCMLVRHDDDLDQHEFRSLNDTALPATAASHWIKLVFGAGQVRWSMSVDGLHWVEPTEPLRNVPLEVTHVGLHCVNRPTPTAITLKQIVVRELPALRDLIPPAIRDQAISRPAAPSFGAWLTEITEQAPPGVDIDLWFRACAMKTFAHGTSKSLGNELLFRLAEDRAIGQLPLEKQLSILAEIALLLDVWDDQPALQRFVQRYIRVGLDVGSGGKSPPFTSIRHALMTTPLVTRLPIDFGADQLLRLELIHEVTQRDWDRIRDLSRVLRFFQLNTKTPLLDWADALAVRRLPAEVAAAAMLKQKNDWRELLIEELNKDVYNALAQLRVELSDAGRDDATRAIASFTESLTHGVAPHWKDEQLLTSLPAAVHEVLRNDDGVRDVLVNQFSELATLRWQQAAQEGDAELIRMLAWQFAPTDAGRNARIWLGDQALGAGNFKAALSEYQRAAEFASPGAQAEFSGKWRLAATLAGQEWQGDKEQGITAGTFRLAPPDFEKLLLELANRDASQHAVRIIDVGPNSRTVPVPPPTGYQVHRRAKLDGLLGNDPNREFARDTAKHRLDWADRQLGITVAGNIMYVSNRFQVAAYDLGTKQRLWQTAAPPGQIQFAQESTFIACRPWVDRNRIFSRLLYSAGATVACIDRSNGQFVWTANLGVNEEFVSDPFSMNGELCCLAMRKTDQQEGVLFLVALDPMTGFEWSRRELLRVRDTWYRRRCCEFATVDGGLLISLGGIVARLDDRGELLWIRKSTVTPPDEEPMWVTQWFQPPFVVEDRALILQPGVPTLECIDCQTGRVLWSKLDFEILRLIGHDVDRWIVQTASGLMALHREDGRELWRQPLDDLTCGLICSAGKVLVVQNVPTDEKRSRFRPRLVWIDSSNGELQNVAELKDLEEADPRVGPVVIDQDRIWTFWGKGQNDPSRDVVELTPSGAADPVALSSDQETWLSHLPELLAEPSLRMFPRWHLLQAESGDRTGLLAEAAGEKNVLGLRSRGPVPIGWGRHVAFPSHVRPTLRLRFGNETSQAWKLEARFAGSVIWSQDIAAGTHPQAWKDFEVELRTLAGKEGWLTVRAILPQGGDAVSYWQKLELVF